MFIYLTNEEIIKNNKTQAVDNNPRCRMKIGKIKRPPKDETIRQPKDQTVHLQPKFKKQ